mgnify:CR=1 FL=1
MDNTQIQHKERGLGWVSQLLLLLSGIFWGCSFVFTKDLFLSEPHITTNLIVMMRLFVATIVAMPFLWITKRLEIPNKKDIPWFMVLSFGEPFIYSILETAGVRLVSGSLASLIIATIPLFVPFAMAAVYKERLRVASVLGVVISLMGIAIMMLGPDLSFSANPMGLFYLTLAVLVAVCYTLALVRIIDRNYKPFTITVWQNFISLIYFIPIVLILDVDKIPMLSFSVRMVGDFLFLGICCSTVAYACFNYGIKWVGATAASAYNNLIPVFSLLLAVLIGQEGLSWQKVVGMIVVITGLFIAQVRKKQ